MKPRRILFVISHPPHRGALAFEMLDELLVGAVFEQQVSVLFIDEGVFQLFDSGETSGNVARGYRALPTYDVNDVFVDAGSAETARSRCGLVRNTGARAVARRGPQTRRQSRRRGSRLMATLHIVNAIVRAARGAGQLFAGRVARRRRAARRQRRFLGGRGRVCASFETRGRHLVLRSLRRHRIPRHRPSAHGLRYNRSTMARSSTWLNRTIPIVSWS